jgi:hypothetical protein
MNPSETLRRIAKITASPEAKQLALQLAAELEEQHNRQNNAFQVALGNAELGWANQLDMIFKRLDQHDARDEKILEMLGALQLELNARLSRIEERQVNGDAERP